MVATSLVIVDTGVLVVLTLVERCTSGSTRGLVHYRWRLLVIVDSGTDTGREVY